MIVVQASLLTFFPSCSGALHSSGAALLLIAAGVLLLQAECLLPGRVLPGAAGLLLTLVGVHRLSSMPLSHAGLALGGAGIVLLFCSLFRVLRWTAGVGGMALVAGGAHLVDKLASGGGRSWLGAALGLAVGGSTWLLLQIAARARHSKRSPPTQRDVSMAWQAHLPE